MPDILGFVSTVTGRVIVVASAGFIFSLLYFWVDIYLFLTKRDFGRVNIRMLVFAKSKHKRRRRRTYYIKYRQFGSIFLRKAYNNRLLFWKVILRARKATLDDPIVRFRKHSFAYAALIPIQDHVAAICAAAIIGEAFGQSLQEKKCWIFLVNDLSPDRRRYILKAILIAEDDLKKIDTYKENPPKSKTENFQLFLRAAEAFHENQEAFLDVDVVAVKRTA